MYKGQKSTRGGIEDFLCPFTDMYISQGSNGSYSHRGIMANDVRGKLAGIRYPYYAPCNIKCIKIFPESGQVMWQSINKVRFANGRIDYATIMTAHDNTLNVKVGQVIPQGEQMGNMGDKGNSTGIHCHIEISQSNDTAWIKNKYNNYHFNNEYDLDDCYFVNNTNIIKGNNGNWKKIEDISVEDDINKSIAPNQIINKGSVVMFDGIFKVDIIKSPINENLFGCCELTGCSYEEYKDGKAKEYHWIPTADFTEVNQFGHKVNQDNILQTGKSYVINKNKYEVKNIDIKTNSAKLNINGRDVWIKSDYLYKI